MGDTNTGADSQLSFTFDEFSSTENNFVNTETSKITKVTGNAIVNIDHSTPPLLNELSPHDKYLELELILKNLSTGEILSHFLNNQRKLLQNIGLYKQGTKIVYIGIQGQISLQLSLPQELLSWRGKVLGLNDKDDLPEQCIGNHLLDNPETPPLIKEYEDPCPELYPADYLDSFSEDDVPEVIEDTLDTLDLLEELLARGYFPLQMEDTPTPDDHGEPNRDTDPANINPGNNSKTDRYILGSDGRLDLFSMVGSYGVEKTCSMIKQLIDAKENGYGDVLNILWREIGVWGNIERLQEDSSFIFNFFGRIKESFKKGNIWFRLLEKSDNEDGSLWSELWQWFDKILEGMRFMWSQGEHRQDLDDFSGLSVRFDRYTDNYPHMYGTLLSIIGPQNVDNFRLLSPFQDAFPDMFQEYISDDIRTDLLTTYKKSCIMTPLLAIAQALKEGKVGQHIDTLLKDFNEILNSCIEHSPTPLDELCTCTMSLSIIGISLLPENKGLKYIDTGETILFGEIPIDSGDAEEIFECIKLGLLEWLEEIIEKMEAKKPVEGNPSQFFWLQKDTNRLPPPQENFEEVDFVMDNDKIDISASMLEYGKKIVYRMMIDTLKRGEDDPDYIKHHETFYEYLGGKFGRVYLKKDIVDFLVIRYQVEYKGLDIPLRFGPYGLIDFGYVELLRFDQKEREEFYMGVLNGGPEYDQYCIFIPQIWRYIKRYYSRNGTMKELIGARTAEINELPSAAFDVFLTPDSAFDIDRMIKKHGTKKTSEIFDSIFVGNYPYSSKFFKTLIEKLMVKMKKQEFILLLRSGDIEYIADLFSDIYDALDSCGIYDTFYIGPNMNRLPIKKRSSLIVDALAIMPTPAPQQTLKTNNINANILYKTIGMRDKPVIDLINDIIRQAGPQTFMNMFASYMSMKKNNSVRSQQLITACQKSLVREYIKNFVTSPEKVNYEDEIKFKFIADLQKLIRNNQRLSYNPLTDRLLDNKTGLSLPIDCFITKYSIQELETQTEEIIDERLSYCTVDANHAEKIGIIIKDNRLGEEFLSVIRPTNTISYYVQYLGLRIPVRDLCEGCDEQYRPKNLKDRMGRVDIQYAEKGNTPSHRLPSTNPYHRNNFSTEKDESLPF